MTDPEENARHREQQRALDVYAPSGAMIRNRYLERSQEVVAVNRYDLETIKDFDGRSSRFSAMGIFLMSGAFWLVMDRISAQEKFELTNTIISCIFSIILGIILAYVGFVFGKEKRKSIDRIFDETKAVD